MIVYNTHPVGQFLKARYLHSSKKGVAEPNRVTLERSCWEVSEIVFVLGVGDDFGPDNWSRGVIYFYDTLWRQIGWSFIWIFINNHHPVWHIYVCTYSRVCDRSVAAALQTCGKKVCCDRQQGGVSIVAP